MLLSSFKIQSAMKVPPAAKLIYLLLDTLAEKDGVIAISQRRISNTIGISRSAISRNLARLKDSGYIVIYPQYHDDGGRTANKYVVK